MHPQGYSDIGLTRAPENMLGGAGVAPWAEGLARVVEKAAMAFGLTTREGEVLHWMTEGKTNREIAIILGISPRTIEKHVEHILAKLGVHTRGAAVRECMVGR